MCAKQQITVVIIDKQPLIRAGIHSVMAGHDRVQIVGEGATVESCLPLLETHEPDVLIIDLDLPQNGVGVMPLNCQPLATLAEIRQTYGQTAVIILSHLVCPEWMQGVVAMGVSGWLLKNDTLSLNLPGAITAVSQGGVYFSTPVSRALFEKRASKNDAYLLTPRQREIIAAIVQSPDRSYQQIADSLFITQSTLKGHLHKAFRALDVTNITACVLKCLQQQLIPFGAGDNDAQAGQSSFV